MNPTLDQAIIDQEVEEDPAKNRAEYLAEFRDDISGWASRELVEAAVDRGVVVRPPVKGIRYVSGVDPSGGIRDSYTASIAHLEKTGIAVLDCLIEICAPYSTDDATWRVAETLKAYGCRSSVGDKYAAQWVIDAFAKCGIKYQHSERDRSSIYLDALPLFTSGRVRLLDNKRLINQFAALERRTSPVGRDRVDHGPGGMDDTCNSAALALVLAAFTPAPLHISDAVLAMSRIPYRRPPFRERVYP